MGDIMEKHTTIIGKIAIVLAISVIFMSTTAVGDIAPPNAQGETMQPVNVTNVQMVNETVHIDLCIENATVKCNFTLMNPGENESLLVGFPVGLGWEGHGEEPYTYPLEDFMAYVDSQPVETEMMDVNGSQWMVWNMSFDEMEIKDVGISYWVPLSSYGNYGREVDYWFTYVLKTGAAWGGVIEEANITIYLHDIEPDWITEITPGGYLFENNAITWSFTSIEPTENIYVEFRTLRLDCEQRYTIPGFVLDENHAGIPDATIELHYWYPENSTVGEIVDDVYGEPLVTTSFDGTDGTVGWYNLTNLSDEGELGNPINMIVVARALDTAGNERMGISDPIGFDARLGWYEGAVNVTIDLSFVEGEFGLQIRGEFVNLTAAQSADIVWNATSFAGFWYDLDDDLATEELRLLAGTLSAPWDRTIDENCLMYQTRPAYQQYALYENEGLTVNGGAGYHTEGWIGERYVAINGRADKLCKLLVEFEDNDVKTLSTGDAWDIGGGFSLTAKEIDLEKDEVRFCLSKNGLELYNKVVSPGDVYAYTADIGGEDDIPVFSCYVYGVFRGTDVNLTQVMYMFLIDDDVLEIDTGDEFGDMEVMTANSTQIVLENNKTTIDLDTGTTMCIMGNMHIKTANDPNAIRFYPFIKCTENGLYEIRGAIHSLVGAQTTNIIWDTTNFAGLWYDLDHNVATEMLRIAAGTLTGPNIDRTIGEGDLVYTTTSTYSSFELGKWGQYKAIGFMTEKYFAGYDGTKTDDEITDETISLISKNMMSKVLIDVEDNRAISTGASLQLEEGYKLKFIQLDVDGGQAQLELLKNGKSVDTDIVRSPDTYVYKKDLGKADDVPVIAVHISSILSGAETDMVVIDGIFQISEDYTSVVKTGDVYGEMEVKSVSGYGIIMENDGSIDLDADTCEHIMGDMYFKIADDTTAIRFYPFVERIIYRKPIVEEEILDEGNTTVPYAVYLILHDPNGDGSYSYMEESVKSSIGSEFDFGTSTSITTEAHAEWFGCGVDSSSSVNMSTTESGGIEISIETTDRIETPKTEEPGAMGPGYGDTFFGEEWTVHYQFINRTTWYSNGTDPHHQLISSENVFRYGIVRSSEFVKTGAWISENVEEPWRSRILNLDMGFDNCIDNDEAGRTEYERTLSFTGGPSTGHSRTTTLTNSSELAFTMEVNETVAANFGLFVLGVPIGGKVTVTASLYTGQTTHSSQEHTVESGYVLEDTDIEPITDYIDTNIYYDMVYGTYLFTTNSDNSCTSEPREHWTNSPVCVTPTSGTEGTQFTIFARIGTTTLKKIEATIQHPDESIICDLELFDDGLHSDGAAGDRNYGNTWDSTGADEGLYYVDIVSWNALDNRQEAENLATFALSADANTTLSGDLNHDDAITTADALICLQIAAGSREYDPAADVNDDDKVTSLDALMIMQAAVENIEL